MSLLKSLPGISLSPFTSHRERFARRWRLVEQTARAKYQFGDGQNPPPDPEPPCPMRMAVNE